jgi:hypothetical protein
MRQTGIDDEVYKSGAAVLLTFRSIGKKQFQVGSQLPGLTWALVNAPTGSPMHWL